MILKHIWILLLNKPASGIGEVRGVRVFETINPLLQSREQQ